MLIAHQHLLLYWKCERIKPVKSLQSSKINAGWLLKNLLVISWLIKLFRSNFFWVWKPGYKTVHWLEVIAPISAPHYLLIWQLFVHQYIWDTLSLSNPQGFLLVFIFLHKAKTKYLTCNVPSSPYFFSKILCMAQNYSIVLNVMCVIMVMSVCFKG